VIEGGGVEADQRGPRAPFVPEGNVAPLDFPGLYHSARSWLALASPID
jgi:hypothetical protein